MIKLILQKSDTLGALASTLCVVHCLATPLIFIAHTCSIGGCEATPTWWRNLDYIFLFISFLAVKRSTKETSKKFMKPALWFSWAILFLLVVNEKILLVIVPETVTYVAALLLAILHLYNLKFCQCETHECCVHNAS